MDGTPRFGVVVRSVSNWVNEQIMWRWAFAHAVPAEDARVGNPRHTIHTFANCSRILVTICKSNRHLDVPPI